MVLFSAPDCIFCDKLAAEVLEPEIKSGQLKQRVKLLEIDIHRGGKVTDFDGDPIRSRIFTDRYKVIATPTVIFMDYDGTPLSKPLMGYTSDSRYPETLKMAIERATTVLTSHAEETGPHIKVGSAAHTDISITKLPSVQ